jgi:hypothetical protein
MEKMPIEIFKRQFTSIRNGKGSLKAELGYYKYASHGEKNLA